MGIDLQSFMMGVASGNGGIQPTGSTTLTENGEYDISTYATATVDVASGGIQGGYTVTFKVDSDDYYIASCEAGGTISEPPTPQAPTGYIYKWADSSENVITFPYTPISDIVLNRITVPNFTFLAHCDDFTDKGAYELSLTNNGVDIASGVKKFGTGSWHFVENADYVKISNPSTYFDFGANDFTIDLWFYPTAFTGGILSAWSVSNARSFILTTAGTAGLLFAFSYSSSQSVLIQTNNNVLTLNAWQHIAVTRSGSNFYIFVNGTLVKTQQSSLTINAVGNNNFLIGKNGDTSTSNDHTTGYIDEIRIMNGICAWTSDFTPPTAPY